VHARFEGIATPDTVVSADDGATTRYSLKITRVHDARATAPDDPPVHPVELVVEEADASEEGPAGVRTIRLRHVEVVGEYDFNPATGRVTGMVLFDRHVLLDTNRRSPSRIETPILPVPSTVARSVIVSPGAGTREHYEVSLTWADPAADLDAHGCYARPEGPIDHVWHGRRPLGPVFWHYGPSSADELDEQMAITSATLDGLIIIGVHAVGDAALDPSWTFASVGTAVSLTLPVHRQSMQFAPDERPGNFWVPFVILNGQVITTDAIMTIDALPSEAALRTLMPDRFPERGLTDAMPDEGSITATSGGSFTWWEGWGSTFFWLLLFALLLIVIVLSNRGLNRALVMSGVAAVVLFLVSRARDGANTSSTTPVSRDG